MTKSVEKQEPIEQSSPQPPNRERFLALLNDITRAALETPDLQNMLQTLADRMAELFNADGSYITLWDETQQEPVPAAAYGSVHKIYPTLRAEPGQTTITNAVLNSGQALAIEDVSNSPYAIPQILEITRDRGMLGLPLIAGDQKLGAVIITFQQPRRFTQDEIVRGRQAAGQIALALAKARVLKTEREQRLLAETLQEVTLVFASQTNPSAVLDEILYQAQRLVPFNTSNITLLEGDTLRVVRSRGYKEVGSAEFMSHLVQRLSDLPLDREVVETRNPLIVPDVYKEPRWIVLDETAWIRSILVVPICQADQVLGLLRFDSQNPNQFSAQDAERLQPLTNAAAIALQNARLIETERRRNRELESLREASLHLTASLDLQPVLNAVLENALNLIAGNNAHIFLYDGQQLTFGAARWQEPGKYKPFSTPRPDGLTYTVARSGERLVIPEVNSHPLYKDWQWGGAIISLPLRVGDKVVGVMNIAFTAPRTFDPNQLRLLELLTDQAAIAIQNVHLHNQVQRHAAELEERVAERTAQLERYSRRQTALAEFELAINLPHTLRAVLNRVTTVTRNLLPADDAGIILWDTQLEQFDLSTTTISQKAAKTLTRHIQENEGFTRWIVEHRQPLTVPDTSRNDQITDEILLKMDVQAYAGVPLLAEGEVLGVLFVSDNRPREYTQEDLDFMVAMANRIAVVITKVRLYEQLAEAKEAAEAASRSKSEFLANMSHELRTPLSTIIGFSEVLTEQTFGPLNNKQTRYLENILSSGQHLLQLVNDILDLAKVEAGRMRLELSQFDALAALQEVETVVKPLAAEKEQTLTLENTEKALPPLTADRPKFKQILHNLLTNAIKYTPEKGSITITIGVDTLESRIKTAPQTAAAPGKLNNTPFLHVSVTDTGIGLSPQDMERIFGVFEQLDASYNRRQAGTGLGLALIQRLVELHNGYIWAKSKGKGQGSTFTFMIPLNGPPSKI